MKKKFLKIETIFWGCVLLGIFVFFSFCFVSNVFANVIQVQVAPVEHGTYSLQQVTDIGSVTTNSIEVGGIVLNGNDFSSDPVVGGDNLFIGENIASSGSFSSNPTQTHHNVFIGSNVAPDFVQGLYNLAIGANAMLLSTRSTGNVAIGAYSLASNILNGGNVAIGTNSLQNSVTGSNNVAIGFQAMQGGISPQANVAIGGVALGLNSGVGNIGIGYQAGAYNTGDRNIFIGQNAGLMDFTGSEKLYIDPIDFLTPLIYGDFATNELMINGALQATDFYSGDGTQGETTTVDGLDFKDGLYTSGTVDFVANIPNLQEVTDAGSYTSNSVEVGGIVLNGNDFSSDPVVGGDNLFIGENIASSGSFSSNPTQTHHNVFIGSNVAPDFVQGLYNLAIGANAMYSSVLTSGNVALGSNTLLSNTSGALNVAIGYGALELGTVSSTNVAIGIRALQNNSGSSNIGIGYQTGLNNVNGSNNIFIGSDAGAGELGSNTLYIEPTSTGSPLILGDFDSDEIQIHGSLRAYDYYSGDNTQGETATVDGLDFKDGLYVSGTVDFVANIPNLQQVTDIGNITTNGIIIGGTLNVTNGPIIVDGTTVVDNVANIPGDRVGEIVTARTTYDTLNDRLNGIVTNYSSVIANSEMERINFKDGSVIDTGTSTIASNYYLGDIRSNQDAWQQVVPGSAYGNWRSMGRIISGSMMYVNCYSYGIKTMDLETDTVVDEWWTASVPSIPYNNWNNIVYDDDNHDIYATNYAAQGLIRIEIDVSGATGGTVTQWTVATSDLLDDRCGCSHNSAMEYYNDKVYIFPLNDYMQVFHTGSEAFTDYDAGDGLPNTTYIYETSVYGNELHICTNYGFYIWDMDLDSLIYRYHISSGSPIAQSNQVYSSYQDPDDSDIVWLSGNGSWQKLSKNQGYLEFHDMIAEIGLNYYRHPITRIGDQIWLMSFLNYRPHGYLIYDLNAQDYFFISDGEKTIGNTHYTNSYHSRPLFFDDWWYIGNYADGYLSKSQFIYEDGNQLVTEPMITMSGNITMAKFSFTGGTGTGNSISWFLSADDGANWDSATPDTICEFTNLGTQLRVRAVLNPGTGTCPVITSITALAYDGATWSGQGSTTVETEVLEARNSSLNGVYGSLDARLEAIEAAIAAL